MTVSAPTKVMDEATSKEEMETAKKAAAAKVAEAVAAVGEVVTAVMKPADQ